MILEQEGAEVEVEEENQVVEEPRVAESGVKVEEIEVVVVAKMIKVVVQLVVGSAGYKVALKFPVSEPAE